MLLNDKLLQVVIGGEKKKLISTLKLKPITFYTYNLFYKNIVNIIFLYIFYHLFFSLAFEENLFPYSPICFFKGRVG